MLKGTHAQPVPRYQWERLLKASSAPPMTRLVGLMLATYTNKDGTKAHPGIERLVRDCGVGNEKTIRRHLLALVDLGLIHRVFHGSAAGRRAWADEYVLTAPTGAETLSGASDEAVPEPRSAPKNSGLSTGTVDSGSPELPDSGVQPPTPLTNPIFDHHADHLDLARETRETVLADLDPDDYADEFDYLHDLLVAEVGALHPDEDSTLFGMASNGCHPNAVDAKVRKMIRERETLPAPAIPRQQVVPPWERPYVDDGVPDGIVYVPDYDQPFHGRSSYGDFLDSLFGNERGA